MVPGRPHRAVLDRANVLNPATEDALNSHASSLKESTGFALVILTIPQLPEGIDVEQYATTVYSQWGIGKAGEDHGVLVVAAINDRRVRLETGYGAEGYLPDAICNRIINAQIIPAFREQRYAQGLVAAANEITKRVNAEFQAQHPLLGADAGLQAPPARGDSHGRRGSSPLRAVIIFIILAVMVSTRTGRQLLFFFILSSLSQRSHRGGGFGGGFSGGGFGGFGGGMSGGGGASGRW